MTWETMPEPMATNKLYYGDNLDVLRRHVRGESVDLVYLDPPFNSDQDYNVLFREHDGTKAAAQIMAFEDTWQWDSRAAAAFEEVVEGGGRVALVMQSFRTFLGDSDMLAYLAMMAPRLLALHRVLRPAGALYLHCDPTASHYLKLLLDAIFGPAMFQSEIIWSYRRWPSKTRNYQHMHDTLLYYAKEPGDPTFNVIFEPATAGFLKRFKGKGNRLERGATTKVATDHETPGMPVRDVWEISIIAGSAAERLGYPTQKPEALLERIIEVSSSPGDVVLDPFCGCGTAVAVAHRLERRWIGIDITHLAVGLIKHRLADAFGASIRDDYDVIGEPEALPDAQQLAEEDPFQFQAWALGLVGARVATSAKKGADRGIDGRLAFHGEKGGKTKQIILSVKAGGVSPAHVRELWAVMEREKADLAALISMEPPTAHMRRDAASTGFYTSPWNGQKYQRLQLLTIEGLLAGDRLEYPGKNLNVTMRRAPRARYRQPTTGDLPFGEGVAEGGPEDEE